MTTFESCSLCFNEVAKEQNERLPCHKLRKLCLKYLHSSFTDELLSRPSNEYILPICSKCWESALQLFDLSEQMKAFQKRISEFIFIFSLEILHRRGKIAEVDYCTKSNNVNGRKSPEVDVSVATNYALGIHSQSEEMIPHNNYSREGTISQNNYGNEFNHHLQSSQLPENGNIFEAIFEGIKCGSTQQKSRDEDIGIMANDNPNLEFTGGKIDVIQKLHHGGHSIATANEFHDTTSYRHKRNSTTGWNKSDSGSSYKVCEKSKTRSNNCSPSVSAQNLTVSSNLTTTPNKSTTSLRSEEETIFMTERKAKNSETRCQNKIGRRKSYEEKKQFKNNQFQCNLCGKRQSCKGNLARHMKIHTGELPYSCEFCNKRFRQKEHLLKHRKTHI